MTLLVLTLCLDPLRFSAAHATYRIPRWVLANGGGTQSGPTRTLFATAGQEAIGLVQSSTYIHGIGFWYPAESGGSDVFDTDAVPAGFSLGPSLPSFASPVAQLRFGVPRSAVVAIRLYDVAGREVMVLAEGEVGPGYHTAVLNGSGLSAGVYFCRMTAPGFAQTRRLVLVK
jgi:hypothetical protein